jgi:hypothetical protein
MATLQRDPQRLGNELEFSGAQIRRLNKPN